MDDTLRLVVGLGNPGPRYAGNRHNIGWRVLDELARRRGLAFDRHGDRWTAAGPDADGLVLLKPLTYMNLSGEGVLAWAGAMGVEVTGAPPPAPAPAGDDGAGDRPGPPAADAALRPLVVCDDLALPLGAVRLREQGSSGGQNGLASLIAHLGGNVFPRLRLGVGPVEGAVPPADWADYVLADFGADEAAGLAEVVGHAADAVLCWIEAGATLAGSRYNRRAAPPPAAG
ncbi:MAG TPA: aminoacyl-tRNA hydrolase [Candidatus Krumholzibacteria bacterium]|nr:aminoacyl-tRNA hydrolase [Candidatus Krumholzibacteria bacterium]